MSCSLIRFLSHRFLMRLKHSEGKPQISTEVYPGVMITRHFLINLLLKRHGNVFD
jgi:hypothetical protein